jgi:predicted neuraminidase
MFQVGAKKWSEPIIVSAQEGRSAQNPVLFHDKHVTYLLHTSQAAFLGQGTAEVRWLQSIDGGITWTEPVTLFTVSVPATCSRFGHQLHN